MEHAKKIVLVPEERLSTLVQDHLSELDHKMQELLKKKGLSDEEKVQLYLQVLQQFVRFPLQTDPGVQQPGNEPATANAPTVPTDVAAPSAVAATAVVTATADAPVVPTEVIDETDGLEVKLLHIAPVKHKSEASQLYKRLKKHQKVLSWTTEGEISYKGTLIPRSNIIYLINDFFRNRKKAPVGRDIFKKIVNTLNTPNVKHVKRNVKSLYARKSWLHYY